MTIRPTSVRLDLNLRALVAEFALRDMDCAEVGRFLGCSPSCARNYLNRLLDAGIVAPRRIAGACGRTRILYSTRPDMHAPGQAGIGAPPPRDPLVAALFGHQGP